jgi:hypothetical protein
MALIDQVKLLCDRLAPLGWRAFLKAATNNSLDIQQTTPAALRQELKKNLASINRNIAGLEDFSLAGTRAVTAGQPSLSFLYHALACPLVVRDHNGSLFGGFATPAELDTLENFVFSLAPVSLPQFISENGGASKVAVVIFSTDYRAAADSVDGKHADLNVLPDRNRTCRYSRPPISRGITWILARGRRQFSQHPRPAGKVLSLACREKEGFRNARVPSA